MVYGSFVREMRRYCVGATSYVGNTVPSFQSVVHFDIIFTTKRTKHAVAINVN